MIRLSYPTLATIAHALLEHRASQAKAVAHWQGLGADPYKHEVAARCSTTLTEADNALRELQATAPPILSDFLKRQIDLIQTTTDTQPINQEAA